VRRVLLDTGPLVAYLNRRERNHPWALEAFASVQPPLYTCESVISEAVFLLTGYEPGPDAVLEMIGRGLIDVGFAASPELGAIRRLMKRYASVPMSLADACLVRMSELDPDSVVLTLDGDFRVYRRNRRNVIPVWDHRRPAK